MSDPHVRPLARQMSNPFARKLLESGRTDGPEPGARDRALLALGLAPVGLLVVAPTAAAAAAPGATSALAASSKAVPWMVGKSLAIGLLGSVVAISAVDHTLGSAAPAAGTLPSAASARRAGPRPGPAAPSSPLLVPTNAPPADAARAPDLAPLSAAEKHPESLRSPRGAVPSAPSVALYSDGLLELDALARVRRALSAHESGRALSLLDDFERHFPGSRVAEEAAVLRIETLRALGRTSEARALALGFLRDRPLSVYAAKVSAMTQVGGR